MEKALLVEVKLKTDHVPIEESLEELEHLARSAGAGIAGTLTQHRDSPDIRTYIGSGKVEELKSLCASAKADIVIVDADLSSSQTRNLEEELGIKVINRTELILDIFAQHAHSREGKLQVTLAQNEYRLTRLSGRGTELSRLGGGIGTRGPGETKLEVDRRRVRSEISRLKNELEKVRKSREILREKRRASSMMTVSLVGYTNAGKSSLMNALAKAGVLVENKLFATLDPVTRRLFLPSGRTVLLTDTVGFIRKIPHNLISAFRATLEETTESDLLLHVVDASSPYMQDRIDAVYRVLEEIKAVSKPIITVFNKSDLIENEAPVKALAKKYRPSTVVSASKKEGLDKLIGLLDRQLSPQT